MNNTLQQSGWSAWYVTHLRSGRQKRVFATSACNAILSAGWESHECHVQQAMPGSSVD